MSDVTCANCQEPKSFVEGIHGPERWVHDRTGDWRCQPLCANCGAPGEVKVGQYSMDGGQMPCFVLHHWECGPCARKELRIEAVR